MYVQLVAKIRTVNSRDDRGVIVVFFSGFFLTSTFGPHLRFLGLLFFNRSPPQKLPWYLYTYTVSVRGNLAITRTNLPYDNNQHGAAPA